MPSAFAAARNRLATAPYPSASACFANVRYRARALLSPSYAAIRLFNVDGRPGGRAAGDADNPLPTHSPAATARNTANAMIVFTFISVPPFDTHNYCTFVMIRSIRQLP